MKKDPQYRHLIQKRQGSLEVLHDDKDADNQTTTNTLLVEQRGYLRKVVHALQQETKRRISDITTQFDQAMMRNLIASMDVAEFYSPPRITEMAAKMGLL